MKNLQIHDLQKRFSLRLAGFELKEEGRVSQRIDHLEEMVLKGSSLCCSLCAVCSRLIMVFSNYVDRCEFFAKRR
jgi:hypothetical protein